MAGTQSSLGERGQPFVGELSVWRHLSEFRGHIISGKEGTRLWRTTMEFDIGRAVLGGLVGTIAMTLIMMMGTRMMGIEMDMPMTLGTMFFPRGTAAWALGLMAHLMMGIVFFIIYAALISAFGIHSAVAGWTALFGAIHALIAGMAFGMMPMLHPRMATEPSAGTGQILAPGVMGMRLGKMAPMAIVAVHVTYGLVGGAIYAA